MGFTATLFETATGKEVSQIRFDNAGFFGASPPQLAFSPDNKLLAACSADEEKTDLYDVRTGKRLQSLAHQSEPAPPPAKGKPRLRGSRQADQTVIFSPDSKIVAAKVATKTLLLWDTATGNRLVSLSLPGDGSFDNGAFTPDGRCLALDLNDGTVAVYELASVQLRRSFGKMHGGAKEVKLKNPLPTAALRGSMEPLPNPARGGLSRRQVPGPRRAGSADPRLGHGQWKGAGRFPGPQWPGQSHCFRP